MLLAALGDFEHVHSRTWQGTVHEYLGQLAESEGHLHTAVDHYRAARNLLDPEPEAAERVDARIAACEKFGTST